MFCKKEPKSHVLKATSHRNHILLKNRIKSGTQNRYFNSRTLFQSAGGNTVKCYFN